MNVVVTSAARINPIELPTISGSTVKVSDRRIPYLLYFLIRTDDSAGAPGVMPRYTYACALALLPTS